MHNVTEKQEKPLKPQRQFHRLYRLFHECLQGYRWFLTILGKGTLFLVSLLLAVSLTVIPLWYLSTTYPTMYGYLVLGALGSFLLIPLFLRLKRVLRNTPMQELSQRIGSRTRRIAFVVIGVFLLLGIFRFYQEGNWMVATGLCIVFLFGLGVGFHRYHEKER